MLLNKNSSRKNILNYIKATPVTFLSSYSDEPWVQPYLNEAEREVTKRDPYFFLHNFSDKPWAQPYVDEAAKEAAKKNPEFFLKNWADRFPQYINLALFALGGKNVSV